MAAVDSALPTPNVILAAISNHAKAAPVKLVPGPDDAAGISDLAKRFGGEDFTPEGLANYQRDRPQEQLREMADVIFAEAPPGTAEALFDPAVMRVVGLPSSRINAMALLAPNGGKLIVLNEGMKGFVYNFVRILAAHFVLPGDTPEWQSPKPPELTVDRLSQLLDWSTSPAAYPRVATFAISDPQIQMASDLATWAERFVLCHEFAHVMLGHHEQATEDITFGGIEVTRALTSWDREYAADDAGIRMLIQYAGTDPQELNLAIAGVELFFRALMLMEEFAGIEESSTHPPSKDRHERVQHVLDWDAQKAGNTAFRLGGAIEAMLDVYRPKVIAQATERRDEIAAKLEALFVASSAGERPDYAAFQAGVAPLIDDYPTATLAAVKTALDTMLDRRDAPADQGVPQVALNRWKLAFSLALTLAPIARDAIDFDDWFERVASSSVSPADA